MPDPRFLGEGLKPRSVLFASEQDERLEIISYVDEYKSNGLSRNASIMSGLSVTSPSVVTESDNSHRSGSTYSIDSDEETSKNIGKSDTPKTKRKEQLKTQEKDKSRTSFRFSVFKKDKKSSPYNK